MHIRPGAVVLFVTFVALGVKSAHAGMITIDGTTNGFRDGVDRVIGWQFTVNSAPIVVTELGAFDFGVNGLVDNHQIGIWQTDQTLVASGTVVAGTTVPLDGFFRYVDVPDVTLSANTTYIIGATWDSNGDELVWDAAITGAPGYEVTGFSVDSLISFPAPGSGLARFNQFSSAFAFPQFTLGTQFPGDPRNALWGANFKAHVAAVPEPGSMALLSIGCVVLVGCSRRCRRSQQSLA